MYGPLWFASSEKAKRCLTGILLLYCPETVRAGGRSEPLPLSHIRELTLLCDADRGRCTRRVEAMSSTRCATQDSLVRSSPQLLRILSHHAVSGRLAILFWNSMSHFDDPNFQAWLQQRDEVMMNAFNESVQDKVTEQTQIIQREARERYDSLVASTSTLELAKNAALKSALHRISVLQAAVPNHQQSSVEHRLHGTAQASSITTWALRTHTIFVL